MYNSLIVRAIRIGLVSMIPVLLIGAFALVLKSFPVQVYQDFIAGLAGGFFLEFLDLIFTGTFGVLAVYMTIFVSRAYIVIKADQDVPLRGAIAASLLAFFILAGVNTEGFGIDNMGAKSMFLAILTGLGASTLYRGFYLRLRKKGPTILAGGADRELNGAVSGFLPILLVAVVFALFDAMIIRFFNVESFREVVILAFNTLFKGSGSNFISGFCFVLLSSVLWFFGIHGSDTLEGVMQEYFAPGLADNQAAVAAGAEPTHILTKQFFDCFVLMGGCGATICLLIAILLFSGNRSRRELGAAATLPMIFNINELMVFGLPIIYNPVMLIPFLLTPLVCYSVGYFAISSGLVPVITGDVEWTTPILIGGYTATGSIAGSMLQMVNVVIGVMIYAPFVRRLDRRTEEESRRVFDEFMAYFKSHEGELADGRLIEQQGVYGQFARNLAADLRYEMIENMHMHYQPQYGYDGACKGVEALLRWKHPVYGVLYPFLVIKLAEECGFLAEMEEAIVTRVLREKNRVEAKFGKGIKISFNVTGTTVVTERFLQFCRTMNEQTPFYGNNICVEVTEQATLLFDDETMERLLELRDMGLQLAIDDFSMGHTSLSYLKNNLFEVIKLDGTLVQGLSSHNNCREIISSIVRLADSLHMTVVAEFVETEEQRDLLHEIGCNCYQGWLYSKAISL